MPYLQKKANNLNPKVYLQKAKKNVNVGAFRRQQYSCVHISEPGTRLKTAVSHTTVTVKSGPSPWPVGGQ